MLIHKHKWLPVEGAKIIHHVDGTKAVVVMCECGVRAVAKRRGKQSLGITERQGD